ncbi:hypothetical protein EH223_10260 [candidate division KSB1 bacterium]|nr:hypothetical protein [candidate division KSB1 bacterium]RQW03298.1 MAG: hypothetical protein EH223_10260 [candidate division KSB1 bacterium]
MNKVWIANLFLIFVFVCFLAPAYTQIDQLHGDQNYSTYGVHSGNQLRTFFWNDGQIGRRKNLTSIPQVGGEWPINSGHITLAKIATWFGSEVRGTDGVIRHIVSESNGTWTADPTNHSSGDADTDTGEWWTMTPLPGFYNPTPPPEESDLPWVAMSHKDWSWPDLWPDKMVDPIDPGWPDSWNGYFGKNLFNADQESFYMMDDWQNKEFPFYPDENDSSRRGLGFRVTVRGFQWSHMMVEDMIFWLFDAENVSTHLHDKVAFGMMCGPDIGGDGDSSDDGGAYDLLLDLGYQYDGDNIGTDGYTPVEFLGLAFLESPGNPYDGIDNDGDAMNGSGPTLPEDVNAFATRTVNAGDPIILIDYSTFDRTETTMPASGAVIKYLEREYTIMPGELVEIENNLIDDNLNGLIDENNGSTYGEGADAIDRRLYAGLKYIDYFSGDGADNLLIDEERDDGIDNDGDWNMQFDDVGLDGVPETGDQGEGDGFPTSGAGTGLPGEPHIDVTDIDESDMIGLTSFFIYSDLSTYALSNDENLWEAILPGVLNATGQIANTDVILGSGYFPLKPQELERFSFAYIYGYPLDDLYRNKENAQKAYAANYNFAKAPLIPTLRALPGDRRVTLIWDDFAEESFDPLTGYDFEGYRIYRSTDQEWNDMAVITDAYGSVSSNRKPVAQFDLDNGIKGFSTGVANGVQFYLGNDTGLVHTWIDTTVKNGYTYYYAVTSYDRGLDSTALYPSECSKYLSISPDGSVDKGKNVAIVRPEAPVAGFKSAELSDAMPVEGGDANAAIGYKIIDPLAIKDGKTYAITFEDTLVAGSQFSTTYKTKSMTLVNVTDPSNPDTLINRNPDVQTGAILPIVDGFQLKLVNMTEMKLDSINSMWSDDSIYAFRIDRFRYSRTEGTPLPNSYQIDFGEVGIDTSMELVISSTRTLEAMPVNFTVTNTSTGEKLKFAFWERDMLTGEEGKFTGFTDGSRSDDIIFLEPNENDSLIISWDFTLDTAGASDTTMRNPLPGEYVVLKMLRPFMAKDVYEFTAAGQRIDETTIDLDRIKVVPNPYVVANSWEPRNQYSSGRGPRELHFTHLPKKCTIRIFNIQGQLVRTLERDSDLWDGTEVWDMLTKDKLDVAFGVYVYHVDAPGIGTKIGKFAIIK